MQRTTITLGEQEWETIKDYCYKNDLKISGFLRRCALDRIKYMTSNNDRHESITKPTYNLSH